MGKIQKVKKKLTMLQAPEGAEQNYLDVRGIWMQSLYPLMHVSSWVVAVLNIRVHSVAFIHFYEEEVRPDQVIVREAADTNELSLELAHFLGQRACDGTQVKLLEAHTALAIPGTVHVVPALLLCDAADHIKVVIHS